MAKDVATILGYKDTSDAIKKHCRWVGETPTHDSLGSLQPTKIIPEGDIYRLVVRSKLPSAERFEIWVFDEVIPALRKTGRA